MNDGSSFQLVAVCIKRLLLLGVAVDGYTAAATAPLLKATVAALLGATVGLINDAGMAILGSATVTSIKSSASLGSVTVAAPRRAGRARPGHPRSRRRSDPDDFLDSFIHQGEPP
jgi:hypothetical protein